MQPQLTRATALLSGAAVLAGVVAFGVSRLWESDEPCPPGTERETEIDREVERGGRADAQRRPEYQGGARIDYEGVFGQCIPSERAEPFEELIKRDAEWAIVRSAPFTTVAPGAMRAGAQEREALRNKNPHVRGNRGVATPYGQGPVIFDDPRFTQANATGIVDSTGRIDDLHYDEGTGLLFAAIGTGGVWMSEDLGATWRPIDDTMPTTVVSAVSYTPAGGPQGTVLVLTGEPTFGGFAFIGMGAWYSHDLGETWHHASGVPDGSLGFALAVDPADPMVVYAATGRGLWRSTDGGQTYVDVVLPTGSCTGSYDIEHCNFANFVTDVVVQAPGGTTDAAGRAVVAAVGWRGGEHENPDGTVQSEGNGIYRSDTGEPGTFVRLTGLDAAAEGHHRLGRIELGAATGPAQDHGYLYAIVQDAVLFHGGSTSDALPAIHPFGAPPTFLNGVYVSPDFGATWTVLADDQELADACAVQRSVFCIPGLIEPGIQAWYNLWIQPDPTKAVAGVPSRVLFGLEEVWQSRNNQLPQNSPATTFEVVGAYYGSVDCLLVATNCAANRVVGTKTVHPDQHSAVLIPTKGSDGNPDGGVYLLVGHDGGLSSQIATQLDDFDQNSWELDQEDNDLLTLLPYSAVWANDGVAWAGLQDNGHIRIDPADGFRQFVTFGADGTFAAVDPENSDYAWEAVQNGGMQVTTDGGVSWRGARPDDGHVRFVNPFVMDPLNSNHLTTGGGRIWETLAGPDTENAQAANAWIPVFDLGSAPSPEQPPMPGQPPPPQFGMSAIDTRGPATYVGFCGVCDILNTPFAFRSGIAINVGTDELPEAGTGKGWHVARAEGLPNRYITSVAIDPQDPTLETFYVTLGGYSRSWVPPGTGGEHNENLGTGHVYKSTDAGATFVDISANLPDVPATWVEPRGNQLLVGTDVGALISRNADGGAWAVLAPGQLPPTPVTSIQLKPDDPNVALLGLYGRGLWTYEFSADAPDVPPPPDPAPVIGPPAPGPTGPTPEGVTLAGPFDWEDGDQGWTVQTTGNPVTSWTRGAPGHDSATSFNIDGYQDFAETMLTSPPLESPGGRIFVSWWSKHDIEGSGFDEYHLEFSTDGEQWAPVAVIGGQNSDHPQFSQQQTSFLTEEGPYFLRFRFFSDFICSSTLGGPLCTREDGYEGAFVDDLLVQR